MYICKNGLLPLVVCLSVLVVPACVAQTPKTGKGAAARARSQNPGLLKRMICGPALRSDSIFWIL